MFTAIQTAYVLAFSAWLGSMPPEQGELAPKRVAAYGGELLKKGLIETVPALWVDVRAADGEADDEGGELFDVRPTIEIVLATVNQASQADGYSNGMALASWALRVLRAQVVQVGDSEADLANEFIRPPSRVRFERIASGERLWAGKLSFTPEVTL